MATPPVAKGEVALEHVWSHDGGGPGRAEIVVYDQAAQRLLVGDGAEGCVVQLDVATGRELGRYDVSHFGEPTSVAASHGLVAVAVVAPVKTDPGHVVLFASGQSQPLAAVAVGALPDMVTFTPDGRRVLVADEGEPSDDYQVDPEGSIGVIDVAGLLPREEGCGEGGPRGDKAPSTQPSPGGRGRRAPSPCPLPEEEGSQRVRLAGFAAFNSMREELRRQGVRLVTPSAHEPDGQATVAQDLEPEYIAVAPDGRTAWVTLQENNALAVVDVEAARVTRIVALGLKDFSRPGSGLDPSDRDARPGDPASGINVRPWPVWGMYQPDGIAAYEAGGEVYLVTANEGDHRPYAGFSDAARVRKLKLDKSLLAADPYLQDDDRLGRLKVSRVDGDDDGDGDLDRLLAFGGRSMAIWTADGRQVYDSGDQLERWIAVHLPERFNIDEDASGKIDRRSPDKGPEPEGVVIGRVGESTYAFVGLERTSAIAVLNVTDPRKAALVDVVPLDDTGKASATRTLQNIAPEGLAFIPAEQSPLGEPLLAVGCEVSGTTMLFRVRAGR